MISPCDSNLISEEARQYFTAYPHALVIEDDQFMRHVFFDMLSEAGFTVTMAANGQEGLRIIHQGGVDFVILDILLPRLNGFEVYQSLRASPETQDIPVLAVTAWLDSLRWQRISRLRIRHFLFKPFTEEELLQAILTLLSERPRPG